MVRLFGSGVRMTILLFNCFFLAENFHAASVYAQSGGQGVYMYVHVCGICTCTDVPVERWMVATKEQSA